MSGGVEVEGLRQFIRNLEAIGVEVQDLKDAFSAISSRAASLAASAAPRRTGKLASTIKGNKAKNKAVVKAGGARVPYAGAINYGWRKRNITPSLFMQKASDRIEPEVIPMLEAALSDILREKGLL